MARLLASVQNSLYILIWGHFSLHTCAWPNALLANFPLWQVLPLLCLSGKKVLWSKFPSLPKCIVCQQLGLKCCMLLYCRWHRLSPNPRDMHQDSPTGAYFKLHTTSFSSTDSYNTICCSKCSNQPGWLHRT